MITFMLFFCVLLAFSGFTKSQTFRFDQPNNKIAHEPGLNCLISWNLDRFGSKNFTHVDLFLMEFIYGQFLIVEPIAYDVDINTTEQIEWEIPIYGIWNGQYVIGAIALGYDYQSYSDHFWILRDYYYPPPTLPSS